MASHRSPGIQLPPRSDVTQLHTQRDLWLAWLCSTGPALWFLLLVSVYVSSQHECGAQRGPVSLALLSVGVVGCAGACVLLQRMRSQLHDEQESSLQKRARLHFMVKSGLVLNVLSLTLLTSMMMPLLMLRPCE